MADPVCTRDRSFCDGLRIVVWVVHCEVVLGIKKAQKTMKMFECMVGAVLREWEECPPFLLFVTNVFYEGCSDGDELWRGRRSKPVWTDDRFCWKQLIMNGCPGAYSSGFPSFPWISSTTISHHQSDAHVINSVPLVIINMHCIILNECWVAMSMHHVEIQFPTLFRSEDVVTMTQIIINHYLSYFPVLTIQAILDPHNACSL